MHLPPCSSCIVVTVLELAFKCARQSDQLSAEDINLVAIIMTENSYGIYSTKLGCQLFGGLMEHLL